MNDRAVPLDDLLFVATWSRIRRRFLIPPRCRWIWSPLDGNCSRPVTARWSYSGLANLGHAKPILGWNWGFDMCDLWYLCAPPCAEDGTTICIDLPSGLQEIEIHHQTESCQPVSSKKKSFTSKLSKLSKLDCCHHICPSTALHLCQICLDPDSMMLLFKFITKIFESLRMGTFFPIRLAIWFPLPLRQQRATHDLLVSSLCAMAVAAEEPGRPRQHRTAHCKKCYKTLRRLL